jgi:membrane-bound ClpP family serine protease
LQQRAVVVREIPPGGFGQVKVQAGEREALLAAQSQEEEGIPAGAEVEVVDCQRSVVVVRRLSRP